MDGFRFEDSKGRRKLEELTGERVFISEIFFVQEIEIPGLVIDREPYTIEELPMFLGDTPSPDVLNGEVKFHYDPIPDQWTMISIIDVKESSRTNLLYTIGKNRLKYLDKEINDLTGTMRFVKGETKRIMLPPNSPMDRKPKEK